MGHGQLGYLAPFLTYLDGQMPTLHHSVNFATFRVIGNMDGHLGLY